MLNETALHESFPVGDLYKPYFITRLNIIGSSIKPLKEMDLNADEKIALEETIAIKRKDEPFWGM